MTAVESSPTAMRIDETSELERWYSDDKVIAVQPAQVDIKNEVRLLRNAIERSGQLSRGQIAAILGVSRRSLSAWVSGETTPSEQNLGGLRTLGELAQELVRQQTLPLGAILRDPDSADAVVEAVQDVDLPRAIRAALRTDSDKVSLALDLTHAEGEVRYTDPETGGQKGQKPAELGALPPEALLHLAEVAGYGTRKYDRYNYLKGYKWSLSFDAMERHLLQFWGGEYDDAESGLPHLAHAAWHCLTLIAFYEQAIGTDDRWQK